MTSSRRTKWIIAIGIAAACLCGLLCRPQTFRTLIQLYSQDERPQEKLLLSLHCWSGADGQPDTFTVLLINRSKQAITLLADRNEFHGDLEVSSSDGVSVELYDKTYRVRMLTAIIGEPPTRLLPGESINWQLPRANLVDLDGRSMTSYQFRSAKIRAAWPQCTVVPSERSYTSGNAAVVSDFVALPGG